MKYKRREVTIHDLTTLVGTEYFQTGEGITFYTEDKEVDELITIGDLMEKFYKINRSQMPLAFVLMEDKSQSIIEKVWQIVMRGSFYIVSEQNKSTEGPHPTKLYFRSFSKPIINHWIASVQIMAFFFNEKQMREAIISAIKQKEFSYLPENEKRAITL